MSDTDIRVRRKSQIAIEYAYQVREENPETTILWAHGADGTRFRDSYKSIATKLKIPGADDENAPFLSLVYAALSDPNTGPWLLILDNVDDLSVFKNPDRDKHGLPNAQQADSVTLQAYLPKSPKGKLLVTSRSKTCLEILTTQSHLCLIAVPPMVSEDCMKLLLSRIPPESAGTEEERHELITELENLPLAISHAAAYIYEKSDFINVPQYLEEFRQSESSRMELLRENIQDLRRDQRPNYSVLRTWDMSFDHIQKNSPLSAKMLFIMSIYSSQNIPDKLLMKSVSENDKLRTVLGPLRQFHLISVHADQTLFDIHRFVQLATRTYLQNIDQLEEYRSIGVKALVASLSDLPVLPPMELRFAYMNYLPHATEVAEHAFAHDDDTNAVSRLLSLMAVLLTNSGDPWKALAASTRATELSIKCSEPDSPERITRLAVHGSCLIESGDPAAGETVLREMLSAVHRQADEDDWKDTAFLAFVFKYRCQLAVAFERQGKWEDSTAEVRKVLELIDSSETRLQDPLYQLRVRLCNSLWQQHRLVEAKDLSEEFLASLQNSTIPNAAYFMFQFLRLLLNIAMQTRRYDRAQKLLERLEPMVDTQFGTKSYNGIMMLHDKAALKVFLNDAVGALGDVERLENITKEIYGDRLPHFILITLSIKGEILEMLGRHTDALTLRERLLRTRTETFGPCHMHTIRARIEVANSLSAMGQIERAMEVVREPIEKLERLPGRVKPETVWSMSHVSGYLLQLGRSTEAFDLGRACVLLSKELPESESELAMRCLFNLGDKLMDVFQYEEASEHLRFALEKTKTLRPEVDPDVCAITSKLVICLENIKETEAAESLLREMEQKTKDVLGPGHDETFLWQQRLGSFLNRQNKFDEAGTIFKEALKQSKIALGPHHFRPVAIQSDLALHYRDCEKPDLAEPLDRETLRLRQEATPIDEYDVFQSMNNLAMTLWHLKKYDEAVTLLNQAIDGRTMRFGGKTKDTDFYRANLLTVRISQEDWTAADTLATSIVAFRTQFFGPHHASTLQTIKKQLRIWENTENWPRMVESYDEIMGLYSAGPGDEDPESMSVRIQLSRAFQETGQHDRVEEILLPIYDCVMDGKVSAFDTSFFCLRLGPALQALQKYVEMESFSRRLILMMAERFPGEGDESPRIMLASALQCQKKHLEAAKVQHKLCLGKEKSGGHKTVYFQTSLRVYLTLVGTSLEIDEDSVANLVQWKEKLIIWSADTAGVRELLVIMARVLRNHDHPDAVEAFRVCLNFEALQGSNQDPLKAMSAKRELQMALNQTEHIREALDLARELQQDWRRHIESNPEVDEPANTRFIIGYNLIAYGEWYEAEVLAQTFYDECLNKRGEDNIVTIEALRLLAAAELACGRYKKAIARYTAALDKQSSDPTTSSVVLAVIRGNLTESHLKNGTYEQARAIVSAPFLPDCEYSGARKRYRLNLLRLESTILQRLREVDRALPLAEDALKEFTSLLGSTADWTIRCVLLLAQICFDRNNMEEAERYVMTAMMRSKKRDVLHNPIIVECQLVLARVYDAQGCLAKAVVMYRQAWMTSTEMFRDDHPTLVGAEREMGVAMAKWCKLYGAKKCEI